MYIHKLQTIIYVDYKYLIKNKLINNKLNKKENNSNSNKPINKKIIPQIIINTIKNSFDYNYLKADIIDGKIHCLCKYGKLEILKQYKKELHKGYLFAEIVVQWAALHGQINIIQYILAKSKITSFSLINAIAYSLKYKNDYIAEHIAKNNNYYKEEYENLIKCAEKYDDNVANYLIKFKKK